jgi:hypothetical protein
MAGRTTKVEGRDAVIVNPTKNPRDLATIIKNETLDKDAVTVDGQRYYIVEMRHRINPKTLKAVHGSDPTTVFVDAEGNPVRNEASLKKIATIDNARKIMQVSKEQGHLEGSMADIDGVIRDHKRLWAVDALAGEFDLVVTAIITKGKGIKKHVIVGEGKELLKEALLDPLNLVRMPAVKDLQDARSNFEAALKIQRQGEITDFKTAERYLTYLNRGRSLYVPASNALGKADRLDRTQLDIIKFIGSEIKEGLLAPFERLIGAVVDFLDIADEVDTVKKVESAASALTDLKDKLPWVAEYFEASERARIPDMDIILARRDDREFQYTLSLAMAAPPVPALKGPTPAPDPALPPEALVLLMERIFEALRPVAPTLRPPVAPPPPALRPAPGKIMWAGPDGRMGTAAFIPSILPISSFFRTIPEGGHYRLDISGSYNRRGVLPHENPTLRSRDSAFYFRHSAPLGGLGTLYGISRGHILRDPANPSLVHPDRLWRGINKGLIEAGPKKYWYFGRLSGSYTNPIFNNTISPVNTSGTFTADVTGPFWDGSRPFWEQVIKITPTLPPGFVSPIPVIKVPITALAIRTFDISGSGTLTLDSALTTAVGSMPITASGWGREQTPGSGLWDVNLAGSWTATTPITNIEGISGGINYSTTIGTSGSLNVVDGMVMAIDSNTAIVSAGIMGSGMINPNTVVEGGMVGKMEGSTSGTFEGKAIGGFNPPPAP